MSKFTVLDKDAAIKLIDRTVKRGASLANDIQSIAVTCIGYANIHGDVTIAQEAVSKLVGVSGVRFASFVKYLETYGQLGWDKDSKNFVYRKRDDVLTEPMSLITALSETRWYNAIKPESVVSIYDVSDMVKKLISKIEKAAAGSTAIIRHAEMVDQLRGLIEVDATEGMGDAV